jgi:hypothetical protein
MSQGESAHSIETTAATGLAASPIPIELKSVVVVTRGASVWRGPHTKASTRSTDGAGDVNHQEQVAHWRARLNGLRQLQQTRDETPKVTEVRLL